MRLRCQSLERLAKTRRETLAKVVVPPPHEAGPPQICNSNHGTSFEPFLVSVCYGFTKTNIENKGEQQSIQIGQG